MSGAALWLARLVPARRDPDQLPRGAALHAASTCGSTAAGISAPPTSIGCWAGSYAIPVGLFDIAKGAIPVLVFAPRVSRLAAVRARLRGRRGPRPRLLGVRRLQGREGRRDRGGRDARAHAAGARRRGSWSGRCWCTLTGYVSLGSIAAAAVLPLAVYLLERPGPAGDALARRRASPRRSSGSIAPTSGGCSTAPRTASAAARRRRRVRDARSPCSARAAGAPPWPICSARKGDDGPALGLRSRGGGGDQPRAREPAVPAGRAARAAAPRGRRPARGGARAPRSSSRAPPSHAVRAVLERLAARGARRARWW